MGDEVVLGIHSKVDTNTQNAALNSNNVVNKVTDGHSWISVTQHGHTEYYGLWPDSHPSRQLNNGAASDIRKGIEAETGFNPASASRYFELSPQQALKLETALSENVSWSMTNTCAAWASETVESVTGQYINPNDVLGVETPRKLTESIRSLEREHPTSLKHPLEPQKEKSWNLFGENTQTPVATLADLSPATQSLHADVSAKVQDLYAQHNQPIDQGTHNTAMQVTVALAKKGATGIERIAVKDGHIHAMQMRGEEAIIASVNTNEAANTPTDKSLSQLAAIDNTQSQMQANPTQNLNQSQSQGRSIV